ncbi:hypothetical protein, partial [Mesorhizobium sp.]
QRHHARQNRIRVNTVAMPLPQNIPAFENFHLSWPMALNSAISFFTAAHFGDCHGMDPRVCARRFAPCSAL